MKTNTYYTPSRTLPQISTLLLAILGAVGSAQAVTSANLLGDPGFNSHPLLGYSTVLSDFTGQQNNWGSENGTLVAGTSYDYVTAFGTSMLSMTDAGGSATQTVQVVDLTSYAAQINTGTATFDLQALFTQGTSNPALKGFSGADAGVVASFFTSNSFSNPNTPASLSTSMILDEDPSTWQPVSLTGSIPVGTTWIAVQVLYGNTSLGGHAGYVDSASLTVTTVPEPNGCVLLGLGAGALLLRSRRR